MARRYDKIKLLSTFNQPKAPKAANMDTRTHRSPTVAPARIIGSSSEPYIQPVDMSVSLTHGILALE